MTTGDTTQSAANWLATTLAANATITAANLKVWEEPAPQGSTLPFIGFAMLSSVDVQGHAAHRLWTNQLWQVRAIGEANSFTTLAPWADAIDLALDLGEGVAADSGIIHSCTRESEVRLTTVSDGRIIRYLGGIYRLLVQKPT